MGTARFTRSKLQEAKDWLIAQLADGQQHAASALLAEAKRSGIAERTLQRASTVLQVTKTPATHPTTSQVEVWLWSLPG